LFYISAGWKKRRQLVRRGKRNFPEGGDATHKTVVDYNPLSKDS